MGEMADFTLEDTWDEEEAQLDYHLGNMPEDEAYDRGIIDELGYEIGSEKTEGEEDKE